MSVIGDEAANGQRMTFPCGGHNVSVLMILVRHYTRFQGAVVVIIPAEYMSRKFVLSSVE